MDEEATFQQAILASPGDVALRLVYADWLEEQGDPRAELLRLLHALTQPPEPPDRPAREARLRALLASGVKPVGPFWTNAVGMRFACIPPGTFLMGSPPEEEGREENEGPVRVRLTRGFCLGVHPVTQAQWRAVMGTNPSHFRGDDLPVEQVSWDDCQEFLARLSARDGKPYGLPTEAEWEYACRAGTTTPFHFGETITTDQANYNGRFTYGKNKKGEYRGRPTAVGSFPGNAWGLYDMHGNVWEWCQDWYGPYPDVDLSNTNRYIEDHQIDNSDTARVLRGGSWNSRPRRCRAAYRSRSAPGDRYNDVGFRVCFRLD